MWLPGTRTRSENLHCSSPSAIATKVANQTSTLQACLLARMSFHVTTLASNITEITARATTTGLIHRLPPIQPTSAAQPAHPWSLHAA